MIHNKKSRVKWEYVSISFVVTEDDVAKGTRKRKILLSCQRCPVGRAFRRYLVAEGLADARFSIYHEFLLVVTEAGIYKYDPTEETKNYYHDMVDNDRKGAWIAKYTLDSQCNNRKDAPGL